MSDSRLAEYLAHIRQAATKIMDKHSDFAAAHVSVPWRSMRGMRNRIAHGYFDIDLDSYGTLCKRLFRNI